MGSRCFRMIQYPEDRFARHSDPAGGEIQLALTDLLLLQIIYFWLFGPAHLAETDAYRRDSAERACLHCGCASAMFRWCR